MNGGSNLKVNIKLVSVLLGVMCFLLTFGICMQIKTVNSSGTAVAKNNKENNLRDKVLEMKEKYEKVYSKVESKDKELSNLIESTAANDSNTSELSDEINRVNSIIGLTTLEGEGIEINLKDGEGDTDLSSVYSVVHDGYLIQIVNELCNAGAEAISINDERIVSTSAITCIGNVIKINDEKVGTPFKIKAIGSKEKLYGALTMSGRYLSLLEARGVKVDVEKKDLLTVNKYDGIFKFEYAK